MSARELDPHAQRWNIAVFGADAAKFRAERASVQSETMTQAQARGSPASSPDSTTEASPFDSFRARRHFSALDGIRAFSILAVVWHHTAAGLGGIALSSNGFLGVDMFFVLSGFLIVTLILREREHTGAISLRRFYARRTLRIFPIYYLVLGCVLVFVTVVHPASEMRAPFLRELPFHLTYTTNWIRSSTFLAIAWSLATEEQFYLLWPPVEKFLPRASIVVVLAIIALNQLVNFQVCDGFLEKQFGMRHADFAILQVTFTPICLGVLLAHILNHRAGFGRLRGFLANKSSPWLVLVALLVACNTEGDISGLPRLVIQVSMTLLLAACVLDEGHVVSRLLSWRVLGRIGTISYGMYLYHHFARHAAEVILRASGVASPLALFLVCTALTIAVAELSFRWIETPLSNLKRKFSGRPATVLV
jgi:peptidoglycan/LPS O-acetylase OafA/YrhL